MLCWLTLTVPGAHASETVSLSAMTDLDGATVVDRDFLGQSVRQLVRELGTAIATQPGPAATSGTDGFEADIGVVYVATEGRYRPNDPSPWLQAHPTEDNAPWLGMPTLSVRKGLPFSAEVGGRIGWMVGSDTGTASIWGRAALIEGYRKLPDVAIHVGYTGYIGNPELDLGVLEAGATLGATSGLGSVRGVNHGRVSSWLDVTLLRATARPQVSDALTVDLGITELEAQSVVRVAAGVQVRSGPVFLQLGASWAPSTIPVATTTLGVAL